MKRVEITVKNNEEKVVPFVWINGEEEPVCIDAKLIGEGAMIHIVGIFVGKKNSSIVFNTNVSHDAANTKSRTTIRGVFLDTATFSNDGLVSIVKGAKHADGYFASKILLFDDAKGRSVPSLEIDENEVKAGHASTVGRPDAEQLFYLQSRGLKEKEAEKIIVSGFFSPVLALFPQKQQSRILQQIQQVL